MRLSKNHLTSHFFVAMDEHQSRLTLLCRVCGKSPKTYMHRKDSNACKALMLAAFGVDVGNESTEIYPHLVCNHCYLSMKRIKKSKETVVVLKPR